MTDDDELVKMIGPNVPWPAPVNWTIDECKLLLAGWYNIPQIRLIDLIKRLGPSSYARTQYGETRIEFAILVLFISTDNDVDGIRLVKTKQPLQEEAKKQLYFTHPDDKVVCCLVPGFLLQIWGKVVFECRVRSASKNVPYMQTSDDDEYALKRRAFGSKFALEALSEPVVVDI